MTVEWRRQAAAGSGPGGTRRSRRPAARSASSSKSRGLAAPRTLNEFMALALGHTGGGYYTAAAARPTRGGDFLTAAELHPIFGATLARQVAETWERLGRPSPFTLVEYGAGAGTLALAILAGLRDDGSALADALAYAPVELNPHRRAELRVRAAAVSLPLVDTAVLDDAPAVSILNVGHRLADAVGEGRGTGPGGGDARGND